MNVFFLKDFEVSKLFDWQLKKQSMSQEFCNTLRQITYPFLMRNEGLNFQFLKKDNNLHLIKRDYAIAMKLKDEEVILPFFSFIHKNQLHPKQTKIRYVDFNQSPIVVDIQDGSRLNEYFQLTNANYLYPLVIGIGDQKEMEKQKQLVKQFLNEGVEEYKRQERKWSQQIILHIWIIISIKIFLQNILNDFMSFYQQYLYEQQFLWNQFHQQNRPCRSQIIRCQNSCSIFRCQQQSIYLGWCPPCQIFTSQLVDFYNDVNLETKQLEILFVSYDEEQTKFQEFAQQMPWPAFPFKDPCMQQIIEKYQIKAIPTVTVLKSNGDVAIKNARNSIQKEGEDAFTKWIQIVNE